MKMLPKQPVKEGDKMILIGDRLLEVALIHFTAKEN